MAGHRAERASQEILQLVSVMFTREVSDPRLAGVTVTRVQVSDDLRLAKLFIAPGATPTATKEMLRELEHARNYFRRTITGALNLKFAPDVRFLEDRAYGKSQRFFETLDQIKAEAEQRAKPRDT